MGAPTLAPRRVRAVLDTNALLQSVGLKSTFRPIYNALLAGDYELVVSTSILLEYEEVLGQHHGPYLTATTLASLLLLDNLVRQRISYDFRLVEDDADDDKFVNAYIAGQADYLVTDDRHFRTVLAARFPAVRVVSAEAFLGLLAA